MKNSRNMLVHLRLPKSLQPKLPLNVKASKAKIVSAVRMTGSSFATGEKKMVMGCKTAKSSLSGQLHMAAEMTPHRLSNGTSSHKSNAKHKVLKKTIHATSFVQVPVRPRLRIGVWDLGAWLGQLPQLLKAMNRVQDRYEFIEVRATVPLGMIRMREGVVAWAEHYLERKLKTKELNDIQYNTVANDFFPLAKTVRTELDTKYHIQIDYLVGVTPGMVAGERDGLPFWNHFSTSEGRFILASTYDLRSFAQETKKPFELFLASIIIAQVLVAQFGSRGLGFHHDNRGCLFDFNENRTSIMDLVGKVQIEKACLKYIGPHFRDAALALVAFIRNYK
jgi:hypothetical protein